MTRADLLKLAVILAVLGVILAATVLLNKYCPLDGRIVAAVPRIGVR